MSHKRIKTVRDRTSLSGTDTVLLIETSEKEVIFTKDDFSNFDLSTDSKIKSEYDNRLGTSPNDIFFHINRDGSIAISTGEEPDVWPEDEVDDG